MSEKSFAETFMGTWEKNSNGCGCWACNPKAAWFVVCGTCGSKRCPKANNHENNCTNSNLTGQAGSAFAHCTPWAFEAAHPTLEQWLGMMWSWGCENHQAKVKKWLVWAYADDLEGSIIGPYLIATCDNEQAAEAIVMAQRKTNGTDLENSNV